MKKSRKRRSKSITPDQLDKMEYPTLEDILAVVNDGKYEKFFLERPKEFPDGSREYMTRAGGAVYGKLVSIIYAVARLTGIDETYNEGHMTEDVVETLDIMRAEFVPGEQGGR